VWKRGKTTRESLFSCEAAAHQGEGLRLLCAPSPANSSHHSFSCSSVNWFFEESFNSSSRSSFSEASVEPKAGTLVAMAETSPISSSIQEPQVSLLSEGTTLGFPSFFCNVFSLLFQISLYLSRLFLESLS
jgi:hypothetical protein